MENSVSAFVFVFRQGVGMGNPDYAQVISYIVPDYGHSR